MDIEQQLPHFRRYARALTGAQDLGDAIIFELLEDLTHSTQAAIRGLDNLTMYRRIGELASTRPSVPGAVDFFSSLGRQIFLLTAMEGFHEEDVAKALNITPDVVVLELERIERELKDMLKCRILIIEDEALIAMHLKKITTALGHEVVDVARTRTEAIDKMKHHRADLVLADIQLMDGSSGIDAVRDINAITDVPSVFITAYPERLLKGEKDEPVYLVEKPFREEEIKAMVSQALMNTKLFESPVS